MVKVKEDRVIDMFVFAFLFAVGFIAVIPVMIVFSMSLTPLTEIMKNGGFVIIPKAITLDAYKELLRQGLLTRAMGVTVYITIVGTTINVLLTTLMAYPLSRKKLKGRGVLILIIIFTMLFNGGIIPTYLVVKNLGLIDSYWAMMLPNAISTFNILIMKSFFENLPEELFESARMDGAKEFRILFSIVLPLSMPVMMTVGLFYMVTHWNEFFNAIMYVYDNKMHPLQVVLRSMLLQSASAENLDVRVPEVTLKMASVIFASTPIIVVYPFIQKYFIKGMMLGAIKG